MPGQGVSADARDMNITAEELEGLKERLATLSLAKTFKASLVVKVSFRKNLISSL